MNDLYGEYMKKTTPFTVSVTWGIGPDLILKIPEFPLGGWPLNGPFSDGIGSYFTVSITKEEALTLGLALIEKAVEVINLERELDEYNGNQIAQDELQ